MEKIIVQIYEIQKPAEAEIAVELGVDRIGSVVLSESDWKIPVIRETVKLTGALGAKSNIIPLFNRLDPVLRVIDYYQPNTIHFCEDISATGVNPNGCMQLVELQKEIKKRFPEVHIMRSVPIPACQCSNGYSFDPILILFEPVCDFFLTDTVLCEENGKENKQPVKGFVGITGKTCDWKVAKRLVETSSIPVVLAGGISPDNVFESIVRTKPYGIDSCTLTNARDSKGRPVRFKKDFEKLARLVKETRRAESYLAES